MNKSGLKTPVIGIAGASGSGKSYFSEQLQRAWDPADSVHLSQDHYYCDHSNLSFEERCRINYDHPDSLDFALLIQHISALSDHTSISHPTYDFHTHQRTGQAERVGPASLVIVEGILIFSQPRLLDRLDYKIFIDTPLDFCLIRRLRRDTRERGRSIDSVLNQYVNTVRPMYYEYVLPSRVHADYTVAGDSDIGCSVEHVINVIKSTQQNGEIRKCPQDGSTY